jgi:hypothetical protein
MEQEDFDEEFKEVNIIFTVLTIGGAVCSIAIIVIAAYLHYFR